MDEGNGGGGSPYDRLRAHLAETATLQSTASLLQWDQETMMPARGSELRAQQLALISALVHRRRVEDRFGEWLEAAESAPAPSANGSAASNLREIRRDYDRARLVPESLIREMAETFSLAMEAWKDARERDDFAAFAPWLGRVVELNRARAQCLGADRPARMYDVLLDDYEPGASAEQVEAVFAALRAELVPLIAQIGEASHRPDDAPHRLRIPIDAQKRFNLELAERLGYATDAGRFDTSTHPFCSTVGFGDTRITSRFTEDRFADAISSTMHEVGHALYEQGLPQREHWGEPLGRAASFAIHESQSRLWENMVGRSRAFWEWATPLARAAFGAPGSSLTVDGVYGAVNLIEPSLIRVDADEATYNLHIMLRFDLERALLTGDLAIDDLPSAWNDRMKSDLGVDVPDDRRGCLQDVHWSMGAIGYFPTYTLGNLYAAQLWESVTREMPDLEDGFRAGEFEPLLSWLRDRIHRHGQQYRAEDLCERVTGRPLDHRPLVAYLRSKLTPLYGL
jgi:carboxypeptidase Taq